MAYSKRALLVSLPGARASTINRLVDEGRLPTLSRLIDEGTLCLFPTFRPCFSPPLLTTVGSGQAPASHGIDTWASLSDDHRERIPHAASNRKSSVVWERAARAGITAATVNWPATSPEPDSLPLVVSDVFFDSIPILPEDWVVRPAEVSRSIISLAVDQKIHPAQLRGEIVDRWACARDQNATAMRFALARSLTATTIASELCKRHDFVAVNLTWFVDTAQSPEPDSELYEFADRMLGQLLRSLGDGIVVTTSPFAQKRDVSGKSDPMSIAQSRDARGFHLFHGAPFCQDKLVQTASIFDLCPTLCAVLGLPVDRNGKGRVLPEALKSLPAWDTAVWPVDDRSSRSVATGDSSLFDPYCKALTAFDLGDWPGVIKQLADRELNAASAGLLAYALFAMKSWGGLAALVDQNAERLGGTTEIALARAACLLHDGDSGQALAILKAMDTEQDEELLRCLQARLLEAAGATETAAGIYRQLGQFPLARIGIARMAIAEDPEYAIDLLLDAIGENFWLPEAHALLAQGCTQSGNHEEAILAMQTAVRQSPHHPAYRRKLEKLINHSVRH